jgi:hypothetical protein
MIENQMAVGEVKEYAEDGMTPTVQQVAAWAAKHKNPAQWADLFFDNFDSSTIGVCLQMLMERQDDKGVMSKDDIRCISIATMIRSQVEAIAFKYWSDDCKSFFDNGGSL